MPGVDASGLCVLQERRKKEAAREAKRAAIQRERVNVLQLRVSLRAGLVEGGGGREAATSRERGVRCAVTQRVSVLQLRVSLQAGQEQGGAGRGGEDPGERGEERRDPPGASQRAGSAGE